MYGLESDSILPNFSSGFQPLPCHGKISRSLTQVTSDFSFLKMSTHLFLEKLKVLVAFITIEVLWININVKDKEPSLNKTSF